VSDASQKPYREVMRRRHLVLGLCALPLAFACGSSDASVPAQAAAQSSPAPRAEPVDRSPGTTRAEGQAEAIFAGGCFWCMEAAFEAVPGVTAVVSGYTGGRESSPTYEEVSRGDTGHFEAVRVIYDPARSSYADLLAMYIRNIDPTQANGQFCDRGDQYRSVIFVRDAEERRLAERAIAQANERLGRRIATEIRDVGPFWVAESYHQDFYRTQPERYTRYRLACERDSRLHELWGAEAGGHGAP
jgi:peptide-methionine (S)-S-oxide reductase